MNKENVLKTLRFAKPDHIDLIRHGRKLLRGEAQEKLKKPVSCTACHFGQWYAKEGYKMVNIPQLLDLEALHEDIHKNYTALYYMTFDRRKKPRTSVITNGVEVPVDEKAFRAIKLKQLEKKTIRLIHSLNSIEKKVLAMQDNDFNSGWFL